MLVRKININPFLTGRKTNGFSKVEVVNSLIKVGTGVGDGIGILVGNDAAVRGIEDFLRL